MIKAHAMAKGDEAYHEHSIGGTDEYYREKGESRGEWWGRGAEALGIAGKTVEAGQLTAMVEGRHPETREMLAIRPTKCGAVDFISSMPKSCSILYAGAGEHVSRTLLECQEDATKTALGILESEFVKVRRGAGGYTQLPTDGVTAALFHHAATRSEDPHSHFHCLVGNAALGPDGRWSAMYTRRFCNGVDRQLGHLFLAEFRKNVTERRGYEWAPANAKGLSELKGFDRKTLREFSERSETIKRVAKARGVESRRARNVIARDSRQGKRTVDMAAVRDRVRSFLGADRIREWDEQGLQGGRALPALKVDHDRLAGPEGVTMMSNSFTREDVIDLIAPEATQGAGARELLDEADRFIASDRVVALETPGRYTTVDLLRSELARREALIGRKNEGRAAMSDRAIQRGLARHPVLNDEQRDKVEKLARASHGASLVRSAAGCGKTTTAGAFADVAREDGYRVIGCGPTARSVRELKDVGVTDSHTVDRLVARLDGGSERLDHRSVVVLDEATQLNTRLGARLEQHCAQSHARLVEFSGKSQLTSVLAGSEVPHAWEELGSLELTTVVRQRDQDEIRALGALYKTGDPNHIIEHLEKHDRLHFGATLEQAVTAYEKAALEHGYDRVGFVTPTNDLRQAAAELVRDGRRERGELGEEREFGGVQLAVNDRVIFRQNRYDGNREQDVTRVSEGLFKRREDPGILVENGAQGLVTDVRKDRVRVLLDTGGRVDVRASYIEADHLQSAYAVTAFAAEGATVERTIVAGAEHMMDRETSYTALSRARGETELFIVGREPDRDLAEIAPVRLDVEHGDRAGLARTMSRSREEPAAMEQIRARQEARAWETPGKDKDRGRSRELDHGLDLGL